MTQDTWEPQDEIAVLNPAQLHSNTKWRLMHQPITKMGIFFSKFYFKRTEDKEKHPLSTNGKRRLYDIILQGCENTQHVED